eukprot:1879499-Prymnesium_polylepis.1
MAGDGAQQPQRVLQPAHARPERIEHPAAQQVLANCAPDPRIAAGGRQVDRGLSEAAQGGRVQREQRERWAVLWRRGIGRASCE